jgi:exodeoxyribonuclease VII small subunit
MELDAKLNELKQITLKMESEEISFDESIKNFEKGVEIAKECLQALNSAKGKITQIKQDLDTFKETEFK